MENQNPATPNEDEKPVDTTPTDDATTPTDAADKPADTVPTDEAPKADESKPDDKPADDTTPTQEQAATMTPDQKREYNEVLRQISKSANAETKSKFNAFNDKEIKDSVRSSILAGEKPDVDALSQTAISKVKPAQATESKDGGKADLQNENLQLRAENALIKAGIRADRIDDAKALFIAQGANLDKVNDFVARFPEWTNTKGQGDGITPVKGQPVNESTAPSNVKTPALNEFEREVQRMRVARGWTPNNQN